MKYRLSKSEKDDLQSMLNIVYSFNTCNKVFLSSFFKNSMDMFEKIYPIVEGVAVDKVRRRRLVPKCEAKYNLGMAGVTLLDTAFYEAVFLAQQKYTRQMPELIIPPEKAFVPIDTAKAEKDKAHYKKVKKVMWYMLVADALLGAWLLIKWSI